jgi:hypothetical protein
MRAVLADGHRNERSRFLERLEGRAIALRGQGRTECELVLEAARVRRGSQAQRRDVTASIGGPFARSRSAARTDPKRRASIASKDVCS